MSLLVVWTLQNRGHAWSGRLNDGILTHPGCAQRGRFFGAFISFFFVKSTEPLGSNSYPGESTKKTRLFLAHLSFDVR